ncbi:MAG: DUF1802 family protein [Chthoniobacterales bacterium]|nr:DUF1802 family protein [Chthoniobacterales bacterium]
MGWFVGAGRKIRANRLLLMEADGEVKPERGCVRLGGGPAGRYFARMWPALKEWDVVCEALGSGRQVIVIRKGGIAEGGGGFRFEHEEFVLLPTFFHQQAERVVPDADFAARQGGEEGERESVEIRHAATVVWHKPVTDRGLLSKLQAYHILTAEEAESRFDQKPGPGVQVALLRVYRLDPPRRIAWQKSFGGCRSWAEMDADFDTCTRVSVLSDERFAELERELRALLG